MNLKKIISSILLITFLLSNLHGYELYNQLNPNNFYLQTNLGKITDSYQGNSGNKVILIQDLHCDPNSQEKIYLIINELKKYYKNNLKEIGIEGSFGEINTSLISNIKNIKVKNEVLKYFMKEGDISGAEKFDIVNPKKIKLIGIENKEMYVQSLEKLLSMYVKSKELEGILDPIKNNIENIKYYLYPIKLRKFEKEVKKYEDGKIGAREIIEYVEKINNKPIDVKKYIEIGKEKKLSKNSGDLEKKENINELNLLIEMRKLISEEKTKLVQGLEDSALILSCEENIKLLQKIVNNECNNFELDEWKTKRESFYEDMTKLEKKIMKEDYFTEYRTEMENIEKIALEFYDLANKRNEILIKNFNINKEERKNVKIIITGGYHTIGITQLLKSKGITYKVIMPSIEGKYNKNIYTKRLKEGASYLIQKSVAKQESKQINLSIPKYNINKLAAVTEFDPSNPNFYKLVMQKVEKTTSLYFKNGNNNATNELDEFSKYKENIQYTINRNNITRSYGKSNGYNFVLLVNNGDEDKNIDINELLNEGKIVVDDEEDYSLIMNNDSFKRDGNNIRKQKINLKSNERKIIKIRTIVTKELLAKYVQPVKDRDYSSQEGKIQLPKISSEQTVSKQDLSANLVDEKLEEPNNNNEQPRTLVNNDSVKTTKIRKRTKVVSEPTKNEKKYYIQKDGHNRIVLDDKELKVSEYFKEDFILIDQKKNIVVETLLANKSANYITEEEYNNCLTTNLVENFSDDKNILGFKIGSGHLLMLNSLSKRRKIQLNISRSVGAIDGNSSIKKDKYYLVEINTVYKNNTQESKNLVLQGKELNKFLFQVHKNTLRIEFKIISMKINKHLNVFMTEIEGKIYIKKLLNESFVKIPAEEFGLFEEEALYKIELKVRNNEIIQYKLGKDLMPNITLKIPNNELMSVKFTEIKNDNIESLLDEIKVMLTDERYKENKESLEKKKKIKDFIRERLVGKLIKKNYLELNKMEAIGNLINTYFNNLFSKETFMQVYNEIIKYNDAQTHKDSEVKIMKYNPKILIPNDKPFMIIQSKHEQDLFFILNLSDMNKKYSEEIKINGNNYPNGYRIINAETMQDLSTNIEVKSGNMVIIKVIGMPEEVKEEKKVEEKVDSNNEQKKQLTLFIPNPYKQSESAKEIFTEPGDIFDFIVQFLDKTSIVSLLRVSKVIRQRIRKQYPEKILQGGVSGSIENISLLLADNDALSLEKFYQHFMNKTLEYSAPQNLKQSKIFTGNYKKSKSKTIDIYEDAKGDISLVLSWAAPRTKIFSNPEVKNRKAIYWCNKKGEIQFFVIDTICKRVIYQSYISTFLTKLYNCVFLGEENFIMFFKKFISAKGYISILKVNLYRKNSNKFLMYKIKLNNTIKSENIVVINSRCFLMKFDQFTEIRFNGKLIGNYGENEFVKVDIDDNNSFNFSSYKNNVPINNFFVVKEMGIIVLIDKGNNILCPDMNNSFQLKARIGFADLEYNHKLVILKSIEHCQKIDKDKILIVAKNKKYKFVLIQVDISNGSSKILGIVENFNKQTSFIETLPNGKIVMFYKSFGECKVNFDFCDKVKYDSVETNVKNTISKNKVIIIFSNINDKGEIDENRSQWEDFFENPDEEELILKDNYKDYLNNIKDINKRKKFIQLCRNIIGNDFKDKLRRVLISGNLKDKKDIFKELIEEYFDILVNYELSRGVSKEKITDTYGSISEFYYKIFMDFYLRVIGKDLVLGFYDVFYTQNDIKFQYELLSYIGQQILEIPIQGLSNIDKYNAFVSIYNRILEDKSRGFKDKFMDGLYEYIDTIDSDYFNKTTYYSKEKERLKNAFYVYYKMILTAIDDLSDWEDYANVIYEGVLNISGLKSLKKRVIDEKKVFIIYKENEKIIISRAMEKLLDALKEKLSNKDFTELMRQLIQHQIVKQKQYSKLCESKFKKLFEEKKSTGMNENDAKEFVEETLHQEAYEYAIEHCGDLQKMILEDLFDDMQYLINVETIYCIEDVEKVNSAIDRIEKVFREKLGTTDNGLVFEMFPDVKNALIGYNNIHGGIYVKKISSKDNIREYKMYEKKYSDELKNYRNRLNKDKKNINEEVIVIMKNLSIFWMAKNEKGEVINSKILERPRFEYDTLNENKYHWFVQSIKEGFVNLETIVIINKIGLKVEEISGQVFNRIHGNKYKLNENLTLEQLYMLNKIRTAV
jgi:hypothetical protein